MKSLSRDILALIALIALMFLIAQVILISPLCVKCNPTILMEKATKSKAERCKISVEREELKDLQKSQQGEDSFLLDIFGHLCGGTYIEMGALNGILYSNTHVFNKGLGWKGILIEPNPRSFAQLETNRPNELARVNAAVCSQKKKVHFVAPAGRYSSAVGGIWEFASESFRQQWWYRNERVAKQLDSLPEVDCLPLKHIIQNHIGEDSFVDFLSLDVEGGELEVLKSIDFMKVTIGIMLVESDKHNTLKNLAVRSLLESEGYYLVVEKDNTLWFANGSLHEIYDHLIYV